MIHHLVVVVEGQTEQTFIKDVLAPYLADRVQCIAIRIGDFGHKGGNVTWPRIKTDVRNLMQQYRRMAHYSTLIDYYGLPTDFPGKSTSTVSTVQRAEAVEQAMLVAAQDLSHPDLFIPYVQMHEFEGLLFSEPSVLCHTLDATAALSKVQAICRKYSTPEDINDNVQTAPSKRLIKIFPGYNKTTDGPRVAAKTGILKLCQACPRFSKWVSQLEKLPQPT